MRLATRQALSNIKQCMQMDSNHKFPKQVANAQLVVLLLSTTTTATNNTSSNNNNLR